MYTNDALFQDAAQKRGKVNTSEGGPSASEYAEVWNAYAKYLMSNLEQRRGLVLGNFCKVGWQVEQKRQASKPVYRPIFQLTEQFCRGCMTAEATRKHLQPLSGDLAPFEDFNFSKAAIKFSNALSKDQVFTGMRSLVQRLSDAIGDGKEVEITLPDIGKLCCRAGEPRFAFFPDLYAGEGLEPPAIVQDVGARSAPAFQKTPHPQAVGLGITGASVGDYTAKASQPPPMPATQAIPEEEEYFQPEGSVQYQAPTRRLLSASGSAPQLSERGATPNLTNTQYKREMAYKEAMDRHIAIMEAKAAEAMVEKAQFSAHINDCLQQEAEEEAARKEKTGTNLEYLKHQIAMGQVRKKTQRQEDIEAASAHDYPKFQESAIDDIEAFMKGQKAKMRADLDEQVRTNNTLRNLQKQRERSLEVNQLEANKQEMAMLRNAERAKKAYDREALATAWNSEIRMKNIWKAIESHGKVGSQHSSHPPQVLSLGGDMQPPPSRGGSVMSGAGRLMTGSSRKVPLGASASLGALQERLGTGASRR